jgi:hypothetical protein
MLAASNESERAFYWRGKRRHSSVPGGRAHVRPEWVTLNIYESAYQAICRVSRLYQCTLNDALLLVLEGA